MPTFIYILEVTADTKEKADVIKNELEKPYLKDWRVTIREGDELVERLYDGLFDMTGG